MDDLAYLTNAAKNLRLAREELARSNDRISMLAVASAYGQKQRDTVVASLEEKYPDAEVRVSRRPDLGFHMQHAFYYITVWAIPAR